MEQALSYPEHWEADVVLRDGGTAHLRPIRPDDAERLVEFYAGVSDESKYFRFFVPYPTLTDRDVERFTHVDYVDRVAIVALVADRMIGLVRYDRVDPRGQVAHGGTSTTGEVAFLVQDAHQGRGLGSVLLEHIAAVAAERGITRFVAEVLPANRKMIGVFKDAGYSVRTGFEEGVVVLSIDLTPTETSLDVMRAREHRAEARSVQRLLRPRAVAVVGAGRSERGVGRALLRHLLDGGFVGPVYAVHPDVDTVAGVPAYPRVTDLPGPVDLAVVAVPAEAVPGVVADCAAHGVLGLLVVSSGFAETGPAGRERQREVVRLVRGDGMRLIGPNSFGVINTDPEVRLNASLSPVVPQRARVGFFSQSGALGVAVLEAVNRTGLGVSTFVSAGNRADVSGNDLLQYWEDDPDTDIVLLYLESIGNPRKFARLTRRIARHKPIVAVRGGRATQGVPVGHAVRTSAAPAAAVDAMFQQSGVIQVGTLAEVLDVTQVLALQPLPAGPRVGVVGNSDALGLLAVDACAAAGLEVVGEPVVLGPGASAADVAAALREVVEGARADSVVAVFVPRLGGPADGEGGVAAAELAGELAALSALQRTTVVSTFLGRDRVLPGVPSYGSPEEAVRALAAVTSYAAWRRRPTGTVPEQADVDVAAAREVVETAMRAAPDGGEAGADLVAALLRCYGVDVLPARHASTVEEAVDAAAQIGYPVALKTTVGAFRHRTDLGGVRLNLAGEAELRGAHAALCAELGAGAGEHVLVQAMARPGVACDVRAMEDPLFGPIVSFGLSGVTTELLGDRAYRIPPLTDVDAADLVRGVRAAPLLFGHRGAEPVDVPALEDLLLRVSRLADDCPEVASLELNPVIVSARGRTVVEARARLAPPVVRTDRGPRRLSSS